MHPRILAALLFVSLCERAPAAQPRATLLTSFIADQTEAGGLRFRMPLTSEGDTHFGIEATWIESFRFPKYSFSSPPYYYSEYDDYYSRSATASGTGLFVATPISRLFDLSVAASALWTSAPMTLIRGNVDLGYHFTNRFQTRFGLVYQRSILRRTAEFGTRRIDGAAVQLQVGLDFDNDSESERIRNGVLACANVFVIGLSEAYRAASPR